MKTLIVAFVLALLGIVGALVALSLLGVADTVAVSIATVIIGGVPSIRESLDKHFATRSGSRQAPVLPLGRFGLPAHRLILYGTLMLFAAMQFASGAGGIIAAILEVEGEKLYKTILGTSLLVVPPAAFLVGRWIGRRSVGNGLASILLIALLARTAATLADFAMMPREELALFMATALGEGSVLSHIVQQIATGTGLFFVLGALGYWRGRRQRLGSYLGYLLRNVPDATRHAIAELAFEEASRASGATTIAQPSNPAVEKEAQAAISV